MSLTLGVSGLAIFFLVIIFLTPYLRYLVPSVSGFQDLSCEQGRKPCPEGYFCAGTSCHPVMPSFDINGVAPYSR